MRQPELHEHPPIEVQGRRESSGVESRQGDTDWGVVSGVPISFCDVAGAAHSARALTEPIAYGQRPVTNATVARPSHRFAAPGDMMLPVNEPTVKPVARSSRRSSVKLPV